MSSGSGNVVSVYNTAGNWDTVNGSNGAVYENSAQAYVVGGGDTIGFSSGSGNVVSIYNTAGNWDTVDGSNGTVFLTNSAATINGSGDTMAFYGSDAATATGNADLFAFASPSFGLSTINGFNSSDTMQFSKSDFASFQALQQHMSQSGANTLITLDASDQITLTNVTASSLTASQFHFV